MSARFLRRPVSPGCPSPDGLAQTHAGTTTPFPPADGFSVAPDPGVLMPLAPPPPPTSPTAVRLSLAAQPSYGRMPRLIDGAWWPHSYDLTAELPKLLAGLPPAWGQIGSVTVNGSAWSPCPGRMLVANQVVRLHLTNHPQAPPTVCLLAPGHGRWDLLVVAPGTPQLEAGRLMDAATGGSTVEDGGEKAA